MASSNIFGQNRGDNRVAPAGDHVADRKRIQDIDKRQDKQTKKGQGQYQNLRHGKPKPANQQKQAWWWKLFRKHGEENDDDGLKRFIARDIAQTPCEKWLTFMFMFIVGSFLIGGGMYLIFNGSENHVVDFIVLGVTGLLMGICFTIVGSYLIFKPVYDSYQRRKRMRQEFRRRVEVEKSQVRQQQLPPYMTDDQAEFMTKEASEITQRRPSYVELYDMDKDRVVKSASSYASSFEPPPPLAIPTKETDTKGNGKPVRLYNVRSRTDDDILVISQAVEGKTIHGGPGLKGGGNEDIDFAPDKDITKQSGPIITELSPDEKASYVPPGKTKTENDAVSRESTNICIVEVHASSPEHDSRPSSGHSATITHNPDEFKDTVGLLPEIENPSDDNAGMGSRESFSQMNGESRPDTGVGDSVSDEDTPIKKKRVLSAVNERRSASIRRERLQNESNDADR